MDSDLPQRFPPHPSSSGALRSPFDAPQEDRPSSGSSSHHRRPFAVADTPDDAVRATDGDASLSRLCALLLAAAGLLFAARRSFGPLTRAVAAPRSAVKQGYLADPFADKLIRGRPPRAAYLRPPLINLGTHARTTAVDALVERFLADVVGAEDEGATGQIVSLGAGSDTRFWRLQVRASHHSRSFSLRLTDATACLRLACEQGNEALRRRIGTYVELDFSELTAQKASFIARSPTLSAPLQPYTLGPSCLVFRAAAVWDH